MSIFNFESKDNKRNREMNEVADFIAYEATRKFKYDANSDPVLKDFRKKNGLPHPKKRGKF